MNKFILSWQRVLNADQDCNNQDLKQCNLMSSKRGLTSGPTNWLTDISHKVTLACTQTSLSVFKYFSRCIIYYNCFVKEDTGSAKNVTKNGKFQEAKYGTKLCEQKTIVFRSVISELETFFNSIRCPFIWFYYCPDFVTTSYEVTFYRLRYWCGILCQIWATDTGVWDVSIMDK
jgi:3D (Asp-Asp-Asp) domain-containing protein